jgi:L-malate glycosyltransferase
MKRVLIIYKFLPQYRYEFFQGLKKELEKSGVQLELIYGKLNNADALKKDEVDIDWARYIPNRTIQIGKTQLIWQPLTKYLGAFDLVIVEQANKLLLNYYLIFARHFSKYKFANWGHGRNMQDDIKSLRNRFKFLYLNKCDWWFAYTVGVKQMLIEQGFPGEKITVVQNAIDTVSLRKFYAEITDQESEQLKKELGIEGSKVAIYCGGMYAEKRLDFMIETCKLVKKQIPDFHMIFVGSGQDSYKAQEASEKYDWIHYVGSKFGKDKVRYFKISSIQLMPGLVGLGILDSFALETPIITTQYPFHSPEIEYLENGVTGLITDDSFEKYTESVIDVLKTEKYISMIAACKKSAEIYTVETMVENFKNGVLKCLDN